MACTLFTLLPQALPTKQLFVEHNRKVSQGQQKQRTDSYIWLSIFLAIICLKMKTTSVVSRPRIKPD